MNILIKIKKQMHHRIYLRTIIIVFSLFLFCIHPLKAQHYLTGGMGYSIGFLSSDELDLFKNTYNDWYQSSLSRQLAGFSPSVGLRWFIEYRHMDRFNTAVSFGSQNYSSRDDATWINAVRELKLEIRSWFLEAQLGRTFNDKYFVNGVLTVYFKRDITLASGYSSTLYQPEKSALTGLYEGATSVSTDLGIAVGLFKDPLFLSLKITYPLFTGGGAAALRDPDPEKYEQGTQIFPDDYDSYMLGYGYKGVKGNIDGWKIMITASAGLKIKK